MHSPAGRRMRKIGEALRLRAAGLTTRKIAASLGIGQTTASEYLKRAERAGLGWPLPDGWSEAHVEQHIFKPVGGDTRRGFAQPDWPSVHRALKRKGVTLAFVWEDYRAAHPEDGYGYSRFCELYRRWEGRLSPTMRQHHFASERAFVDYAGDTLEIVDGATGEVHRAQIFVGVLGASNYTFVEASWTQSLPDWIASHVRMLEFFGGAPGHLVSDNLKAGVTTACFYEPKVNRTYADLATHYDTAILPARPYRPRDKAKVEVGVQLVQRWIVARLRGRRFFSLAELNTAIRELLERFNGKVTRHLGASRRQLFETLDRPALKPLPATPYEYAEWVERKVGLDYHVEVGKHYYSVPHTLLKQSLWARVTARTVEIFREGQRVAAHVRTSGNR
ncbi:MAG: IS21 family transposase, partial [Pseudomonadota bacterium]